MQTVQLPCTYSHFCYVLLLNGTFQLLLFRLLFKEQLKIFNLLFLSCCSLRRVLDQKCRFYNYQLNCLYILELPCFQTYLLELCIIVCRCKNLKDQLGLIIQQTTCICVYICEYTYICMYVGIYIYIYVHMCMCTHIGIFYLIYTYIFASLYKTCYVMCVPV